MRRGQIEARRGEVPECLRVVRTDKIRLQANCESLFGGGSASKSRFPHRRQATSVCLTAQRGIREMIDWNIVAIIAAPLVTLFVGAALTHAIERRPRLVTYLGYVAAHRVTLESGVPFDVYTHSVVLKNAGRRAARNVCLTHSILPNFSVCPSIKYRTEQLPSGEIDIVFPRLSARARNDDLIPLFATYHMGQSQRTRQIRRRPRKGDKSVASNPASSLGQCNCFWISVSRNYCVAILCCDGIHPTVGLVRDPRC